MSKIIFIVIFSFSFLWANTLEIKSENQILDNFKMEVFEDKTASLSLKEIVTKNFTPASSRISTGYSESYFWFRFKVKNKTNREITYILESTESFTHEVDCFILSENENILKYEKGFNRYNENNQVENINPQFPINLKKGERSERRIQSVARVASAFKN